MADRKNHSRLSSSRGSPAVAGRERRRSGEFSPPIPSVNERLGQLRPSRELLEYYRKKIADYDGEHEEMIKKLEDYKITYEQQHKKEWELRQREEEIAELQKALSDMQVYLYQEREHVLRLYAENDRLKIRELEDRKQIQHLTALAGATDGYLTYLIKEPPKKNMVKQYKPKPQLPHSPTDSHPHVEDKLPRGQKSGRRESLGKRMANTRVAAQHQQDNESLMLQVEALQAQMEEQARTSKAQVDTLMEDRRVRLEEMQTLSERDRHKIQSLSDKLQKTQNLLYESTKDYLELKYESRGYERKWMSEKDRLLKELDRLRDQLNVSKDDVVNISENAWELNQTHSKEIESLENQLKQAEKLCANYRDQVIELEGELSRFREKDDVSKEIFKERSGKMSKRLELMNKRYQALEKRRNLEVEGFKTDIRHLRARLKEVERQLYKVTLGMGDTDDVEIMKRMKSTAQKSKKMQGELHRLKSKIYGLEKDLMRV